MPQVTEEQLLNFRHHLVNGICGIRASEQLLRDGKKWVQKEGEYIEQPVNLTEELDNLDAQIKRIMEAFTQFEINITNK